MCISRAPSASASKCVGASAGPGVGLAPWPNDVPNQIPPCPWATLQPAWWHTWLCRWYCPQAKLVCNRNLYTQWSYLWCWISCWQILLLFHSNWSMMIVLLVGMCSLESPQLHRLRGREDDIYGPDGTGHPLRSLCFPLCPTLHGSFGL